MLAWSVWVSPQPQLVSKGSPGSNMALVRLRCFLKHHSCLLGHVVALNGGVCVCVRVFDNLQLTLIAWAA